MQLQCIVFVESFFLLLLAILRVVKDTVQSNRVFDLSTRIHLIIFYTSVLKYPVHKFNRRGPKATGFLHHNQIFDVNSKKRDFASQKFNCDASQKFNCDAKSPWVVGPLKFEAWTE